MKTKPKSLDSETLVSAIDMLNGLSTKECLVYGNSTWQAIVNWLLKLIKAGDSSCRLVKNLLQAELDTFVAAAGSGDFYSILNGSNRIAKLALMICDVDDAINSKQSFLCKPTFEILIDKLTSCNKHVYASIDKTEKFLFVFHFMMYHLNSIDFHT